MAEEKEGQAGAQETDAEVRQRMEFEREVDRGHVVDQVLEALKRDDPPEPEVKTGPDEAPGVTSTYFFAAMGLIAVIGVGFFIGWLVFASGDRSGAPIYEKTFTFDRLAELDECIEGLEKKLADARYARGAWRYEANRLLGRKADPNKDIAEVTIEMGQDNFKFNLWAGQRAESR